MTDHFDIVIAGGGLVGASLACALADTPLRIAVVEPFGFSSSDQPSYDERTVALTWSARQIYSGMGVWQKIVGHGAEPIKEIHVSNQGHFGMTHLSHTDAGTTALGYVVPTRVIGHVLQEQIAGAGNIKLLCPASVTNIDVSHDKAHVDLQTDQPGNQITASLVVIADGGRSGLTERFVPRQSKYDQQALLTIVSSDRPHKGRAFERFTREGPLAMLPLSGQRYAVVWTCLPDQIDQRMALDDANFIESLQEAFGDRAGNLSRPAPRKSYPLQRGNLSSPVSDRMLVIGNAAHSVHPVAGQGFNLGLRDVAVLAECLYIAAMNKEDPGDPVRLNEYARLRKRDTKMVGQFTHGLIQLFSNDLVSLGLVRNLALKGIEIFPPAKRFLLRRTMGMTGKQSSLAMGLPLSTSPTSGRTN